MLKENKISKNLCLIIFALILSGLILFVKVKYNSENKKVEEVLFDKEIVNKLDSYTKSYIRKYGYPNYALIGDYCIIKDEDDFKELESTDLVLVWDNLKPNENSVVSIVIFVKKNKESRLEHIQSYEFLRDRIKRTDFKMR